jgi:uncharacterized protein YjbI with pentapeptide repeats
LRTALLAGAKLIGVNLVSAQLEDVDYPNAQLQFANLGGAHLTGSSLPSADLRKANLRGATFHLGSSRSELVGSLIACEGSKTGFYTDDYEDMNFKRPEDVRKANLRGAVLTNVDFYLGDLRDAQLDPTAREHARQCGPILADVVA